MLEAISKAQGAFVWCTSHPFVTSAPADLRPSVEAEEGRQVSRIRTRRRTAGVLRIVSRGYGQRRVG